MLLLSLLLLAAGVCVSVWAGQGEVLIMAADGLLIIGVFAYYTSLSSTKSLGGWLWRRTGFSAAAAGSTWQVTAKGN